MVHNKVLVGIMQRKYPLHPDTVTALSRLMSDTIVIDSTPQKPVVEIHQKIKVIHKPDPDGFFAITLLIPLFTEFLTTNCERLFLIEGDMVLSDKDIARAQACTVNTKAFYAESNPSSPHAYVRREGLAGVLLRSECKKMLQWMLSKPLSTFKKYQGYCDTFLWYAVSSESTGYSTSTEGPDWIPIKHMTHGDYTRVTKAQRKNMKIYRARMAETINLAMECNAFEPSKKYQSQNAQTIKLWFPQPGTVQDQDTIGFSLRRRGNGHHS